MRTFKNITRSSHPEVYLGKGIMKICCKFTAEHPCRSVISIKLHKVNTSAWVFSITLRHGCSPENLLHILKTPFPINTSGRLLFKT